MNVPAVIIYVSFKMHAYDEYQSDYFKKRFKKLKIVI